MTCGGGSRLNSREARVGKKGEREAGGVSRQNERNEK